MKEKIIGLIPARMGSSRFPGKPIADICGKPMIYWVYKQATKVKQIDEIYVVTGDEIIAEKCKEFGIPCWIERQETSTAAEKLSYVARKMNGDIYLNIQGDEPLIQPEAIQQVIDVMIASKDIYYLGLRSRIKTEEEFKDRNVVKAVVDINSYAMYFSRSPIPYTYDIGNAFRVLGLYGYRADFLKKFADFTRSKLESLECGVEMLRVMERRYKIKLVETEFDTIGVDLPEHIPFIEERLKI
jgi:3-deoxy-manno-octulosonate cytidylyltransferase (CMP-KDO synthetase)